MPKFLNQPQTFALLGLSLLFAACGQSQQPGVQTDVKPAARGPGPATATARAVRALSLPSGTTYLSDLTPNWWTNGWGGWEKDKSNGEQGVDGKPLSLGGQGFTKGLGVHSYSQLDYDLAGSDCTTLSATIGVDDEVGERGSVVFRVTADLADGSKDKVLYTSPVLKGSDAGVPITVDLSGATYVRLKVDNAGDNYDYDHADWADAKITCGSPATTPTPAPGAEGSWSNPATWGGSVPAAGADVTIPAGQTVLLDQDLRVRHLTVLGNLVFARKDLNVSANWIMVHGPGALRIGTPDEAFTNKVTITLTGNDPSENVMGMGSKFLGAMMGGKIEMYGEKRLNWTQLGATANAGDSAITLKENVDWRVGEQVVVASTMLDPSEAETRTVTGVSGSRVTLDAPLAHRHWGTVQSFDAGRVQTDQRAEVGLLSRNIVIQGDDGSVAAKFGGHVMVMGSDAGTVETDPSKRGSAKIRGVEFRRLGQFNALGRYPFHWHRNGESKGDFVEGSAVHDAIQRGIVVHQTSDVVVKDNVVYGTPGHAISIETGAEMDNTIDGNLALNPQPITLTQDTLRTQGDDQAAAYWIKGVNNVFTNNVAGGGQFGGFWFDDPEDSGSARLTFTGNTVHSHAGDKGAGIWLEGRRLDFAKLNFSGLNIFKNRVGFWPDNDAPATANTASFADNMVAFTGDGTVADAAIIGRTANTEVIGPSWADRWGGSGMRVYNNAASMNNVTYLNFTDDASAVSTAACRNEGVRYRAQGVRWVNATPSFCEGDTLLVDADGSFTGTGKLSSVVADPMMYTAADGCTPRTAWGSGVVVCPKVIDYQYLFIQRDLGVAPEIGVKRDLDGLKQSSTYFPGYAVTIPGQNFSIEQSLDDVSQMNLYLGKSRKDDGSNADPASRVQVSVPVSSANVKVWRSTNDGCFTCGFNPNNPDLRRSPLVAATSLAELKAADGAKYFYDASSKKLYLLLGAEKPVFIERGN